MRAYPPEGGAEVYLGHADNHLYVGIKGYEPSTANLAAAHNQRDTDVYKDDCIEIYIDHNLDYHTFNVMQMNTIGTISDGSLWELFRAWDGRYTTATQVEDTFWVAELAIPLDVYQPEPIKAGDIWGFNVARVRIANASEYGQWVPTYGNAWRPNRFGFLVFD